jgi:hypothetical protein
MPFDDPASWMTGANALKTALDSIRSAIGMVKDVRSLGGGSEQQQNAIDAALTVASSSTAIAEAELAKAFGYELCKCEFPPTPMRTVGYFGIAQEGHKETDAAMSVRSVATPTQARSNTRELRRRASAASGI